MRTCMRLQLIGLIAAPKLASIDVTFKSLAAANLPKTALAFLKRCVPTLSPLEQAELSLKACAWPARAGTEGSPMRACGLPDACWWNGTHVHWQVWEGAERQRAAGRRGQHEPAPARRGACLCPLLPFRMQQAAERWATVCQGKHTLGCSGVPLLQAKQAARLLDLLPACPCAVGSTLRSH